MCERQNTIVSAFDLTSLRISAYEIYEWIYAEMCRNDQEVTMVEIDGPKRHVYEVSGRWTNTGHAPFDRRAS